MRKWPAAVAAILPMLATAALGEPTRQTPTPTVTRYDEDWSTLADPAVDTGRRTDRLKYIPLGDDGIYLTSGLDLRLRNESFRNNLWGAADAPDDAYLLMRAMPYADLHMRQVRAFVQPIAAYAAGVSPSASPIDETGVDLLQGFADARLEGGGADVTLRGGRQMLSLGSERLIGTRYGPNVPLAFDGGRVIVQTGDMTVSLLAVRPVTPGKDSFDDKTSSSKALWGAYATVPGLDFYYLGYRNRDAAFGGRTGQEVRHNIGLRSFGDADSRHWNVEGVVQFGHFAGQTIGAWTLATEVGQRFPDAPLSPDVTLRFNLASGDTDATDNRLGTFNALFPKGKYFGELSPIGPYNIINLNPLVSFALSRTVTFGINGQAYWRYSRADGIYDVPGHLLRAAGNADGRFIGKEIETMLGWQATPELALSGSLSAFFPGAFVRQTGPARTICMLGLEAGYSF